MTTPVHRCERGRACRAWELLEHENRTEKVGAVCDRPLCDTCERAITQALDDAPMLYVQLRAATLMPGQVEQTEQVSISRGSPMPVNAAAFHHAEALANLLGDGEDEVRRVARWTRRRTDGLREGRRVADSARFLERNLTAWITADLTGPCALLDWRAAVRRLPGFDPAAAKAVRRYTQRCPGCGVRAITHRAGDDLMVCQNCSATHPYQPTVEYGQEPEKPLVRPPAAERGPESDVAGQDARSGRAAHTWEEGAA